MTSVSQALSSDNLLAEIPLKTIGYGCATVTDGDITPSKSESDGLSDSLSDDVISDQFELLKSENTVLQRKLEESQLVIQENKEVIKSLG